MADRESFLRRWSRRKIDSREDDEAPVDGTGADAAAVEQAEDFEVPDLPDIETLDAGSDFSVFMQNGVPGALRREALRRLWRLDPSLGACDGLVEYGEDYVARLGTGQVVQTAWRFGRGMVNPVREETFAGGAADEPEDPDEPDAAQTVADTENAGLQLAAGGDVPGKDGS